MPSGIRRYGPGKFNTILDSAIYDLSLDGGGDDCGDVSEIGIVYSRIELGPDAIKDIEAALSENDENPLTPEEKKLVQDSFGAILTENDQGFVSVDYIKTEKEYNKDWEKIEEEVEEMYDGDEEEEEESETETAEEESE